MNLATNRKNEILVLVPSYNDMETVVGVEDAIASINGPFRTLILDDGSVNAGTFAERRKKTTLFFRLPGNFGLGSCMHIGIDHMLKYGYSALVRIDADGQHPASQIPLIVAPLLEHGADMVIGSRKNHNEGKGIGVIVRRLIKGYFSNVARLIGGKNAPKDVNTGFFALNVKAARTLNQFQLERFPEPEMFILACREKLQIKEVFIDQSDRKQGKSSLGLIHAARLFYRFNIFVFLELFRETKK
jgi:glycosyltransferase involved in cell wall biosynthesis